MQVKVLNRLRNLQPAVAVDRRAQTLPGLQALRALAALAVVLFHMNGAERAFSQSPIINPFFYFGDGGVNLFFLLSGFIIT